MTLAASMKAFIRSGTPAVFALEHFVPVRGVIPTEFHPADDVLPEVILRGEGGGEDLGLIRPLDTINLPAKLLSVYSTRAWKLSFSVACQET